MSEPDLTVELEGAAPVLAFGGVAALLLGWVRGSGLLRLVGLVAFAAGVTLYAREKLAERSEKIEEAQDTIRAELDDLDPVARAQVIEGLARSELSEQ